MKQRLVSYGPSLIVISTVALVLFAGPFAIRQLTFAHTEANITLATHRLQSDDNILISINMAHRDIGIKVEPSVVYISTERLIQDPRNGGRVSPVRLSSGSGWVYDTDGHIVTNAHVIEDAERIEVQLSDGDLRLAEVIGTDLRTDIAVIRIAPGGLHQAERGDTSTVEQGDQVFAFGSPFDFRFSMSQGIVSGKGRRAQLEAIRYQNFIQTDAAINPGNSGGPLTDIYGRVIGMNTAIATGRPGSQNDAVFSGIGLAIPVEMIESVVDQLIDKGEVSRGFIGVELHRDLREGTAQRRGFVGEGVEIKNVNKSGPADAAGLLPGDVVISVEGTKVNAIKQIQSIISAKSPGETISIEAWRLDRETNETSELTLAVTLTEMPPPPVVLAYLRNMGFYQLETATTARAEAFGTQPQRGVIVEQIIRGSSLDGQIEPGSIITHVGADGIQSVDEFYARMERVLAARLSSINLTMTAPGGGRSTISLRIY